jgi:hypothetical protein
MAEQPTHDYGEADTPTQRYDPEAEHRVKASALMESLHIYLDENPERARLMIDAAAVSIQIADHYQRIYQQIYQRERAKHE